MSATSGAVTIIATVSGLYFVILSAFGIRAVGLPCHVSSVYSVTFAVVVAFLAFPAFRAAILGKNRRGYGYVGA